MPSIAAVAPALPPFAYPQERITEVLTPMLLPAPERRALLRRLHAASGVRTRHLALPLERYADLGSFTASNGEFIRVGTDLAVEAVEAALAQAGLAAADVDFLLFTTVTGVSAPSLDALLVSRLGMRPDVKRLPSFGLGCVAGAAGLARVADYLVGHPDEVALLVSVELCSLTLQHDDDSAANLVASGLFGDGAAAVVMVGDGHPAAAAGGPGVVATRSRLYPGTEGELGWDVGSGGFRIVLSPALPEVLRSNLGADVEGFLADHDLKPGDVGTWVVHAGGPKVLDAVSGALSLPEGALELSWRSLERVGNLSSASVLHVLADALAVRGGGGGAEGAEAVVLAVGPGVSVELVLLRWPEAGAVAGVGS
ncbi:alkylresorcinol/alkylpyrone synthase [Kineococcus xinjiangensis]|uniref:Alkylresorcinol/alkylpyrone synthase n=1 Tax=Kineococcus xinjiangensis TaxID=512762 RepID=A0A2S6IDX3_9ACTN|nr:3-oxoacyl-[acyl-carrier-protein] synthase III C-terminal domain-containing protein [Kineococcus xinjiangensis]PPK92418.1 alkylresorcinol/alkylpyrone synthase [Kineococcus xinjiangensis]